MLLTLVLRVRFTTVPDLMTRSNSKLPFSFTGDMTWALALLLSVSSFMPSGRMGIGIAGEGCLSAMVAPMVGNGASNRG